MTIDGLQKLMTCVGNKITPFFSRVVEQVFSHYQSPDTHTTDEKLDMFGILMENRVSNQPMSRQVKFIYASQSAAFPGLIKIGKTRDVKARLSQLNTACAPMPHVLVAQVPSLDYSRDECEAHAVFAQFRKQGEFFEISAEDVNRHFQTVMWRFIEESKFSLKKTLNCLEPSATSLNQLMSRVYPVAEQPMKQQMKSHKRKLEELENDEMEQTNKAQFIANQTAEADLLMKTMTAYREICRDSTIDERFRKVCKDVIVNIVEKSKPKSVRFTDVAWDMGYEITGSSDVREIAKKFNELYIQTHGMPSSDPENLAPNRLHDGQDYSLLMRAIRQYVWERRAVNDSDEADNSDETA